MTVSSIWEDNDGCLPALDAGGRDIVIPQLDNIVMRSNGAVIPLGMGVICQFESDHRY